MWEPPPGHPLRRMFAGLTEQAFVETLGVADPLLIDYVTGLLSRFLHADRLRPPPAGPALTELVNEAGREPWEERLTRERHRHLGDLSLFWSGLYPNAARRPAVAEAPDYAALGKRSYYIASTFTAEGFAEEAPVLRRLAEQFELCAEGLREVRREFESLAGRPLPPGAGLIGS